ncbi:MAG: carbon-nitrogen hydrolase family protein [Sedimentisphaerales bacterium]|nr:carbon-nitrogen hydrolase family protein [Sedimentisphaerales bacterium]
MAKAGTIKIATCQFAVGDSVEENSGHIQEFLKEAKKLDADIVHFSECALSGYAGSDFDSLDEFDWDQLIEQTKKIMALAGELQLWVVLGSMHRLTEPNKPHNSLYLINPAGQIEDRYDKRFCTERDLNYYTPGNRFVTFEINSVKCALLICFDLRFPEIYRELCKSGVHCIIQSFYNARQKEQSVHRHIIRQTMQANAASNYFWVSLSNSSAPIAPYSSCFIRPDGEIVNELKLNKPGIMVNTVDISKSFYDPTAKFRKLAMDAILTNGPVKLDDVRNKDTKSL